MSASSVLAPDDDAMADDLGLRPSRLDQLCVSARSRRFAVLYTPPWSSSQKPAYTLVPDPTLERVS